MWLAIKYNDKNDVVGDVSLRKRAYDDYILGGDEDNAWGVDDENDDVNPKRTLKSI